MITSPLTYVLDSSVIIDVIHGDIVKPFFQLPIDLYATDLLLYELRNYNVQALLDAGLQDVTLPGFQMLEVIQLGSTHKRLSVEDRSAYVLARWNGYGILTGDGALRELAEQNGVDVHGTLWVLDCLVNFLIINPSFAAGALTTILKRGSRLPKVECDKRFRLWK